MAASMTLEDMARQMVHMEQVLTTRVQTAEGEIVRLRQEVANAAATAGGGGSGPRTGDDRKGYKDGLRDFSRIYPGKLEKAKDWKTFEGCGIQRRWFRRSSGVVC